MSYGRRGWTYLCVQVMSWLCPIVSTGHNSCVHFLSMLCPLIPITRHCFRGTPYFSRNIGISQSLFF
jgi:hypothetical protein